jgi:hypothetical protein
MLVCRHLTDPLSGAPRTELEQHFIDDRVRSNGWLEVSRGCASNQAAVDGVPRRELARGRPRCDK